MTVLGIHTDTSVGEPAPAPLARTIVDLFLDHVRERPAEPALRWRSDDGGGEPTWTSWSWAEYGEQVWDLATALIGLGVGAGDRVAIASANRPEWHVADMAVVAVGAVSVPVYPTSTSSQIAYVLGHSGAKVAFVDTAAQLAKVLLRLRDLESLDHVVVMDDVSGLDADSVITLATLRGQGAAERRRSGSRAVDDRLSGIGVDDLLSIVYTSGTTGPPKGVMLSHGNVIETVRGITRVLPIGPDDRFLSFLPLSHVAERVVSHFGQIVSGGETWFARSLDTVPADLQACRPTIFVAVPRLWEKSRDGVLSQIGSSPEPVRQAFQRLVDTGLQVVAHRQDGAPLTLRDRLAHLGLDQTIGKAVRHRLGLDRARILVTTAAPISTDLLRWLHAIGLPVAEVYGQTEDCGPSTINPPDAIRIGSVGRPIPGLQVHVGADHEVLVKGPTVTSGYYHDPEGTAELIDEDGWMRTGDQGRLDADGYLWITGRKKDLIVNAAGKNIAPQPIELALRSTQVISQAVVVGDGRPYLVALLTPAADEIATWPGKAHLAADADALVADPDVLDAVGRAVDEVNASRAPVEQIKRWRLLTQEPTVESGELTPTLKVRRSEVIAHHTEIIDELYATPRASHARA